MSANTVGRHVWLALVLAVAAAVLSSSPRGEPYQALVLFSADAAAVAGAIGTNPDLVVPP